MGKDAPPAYTCTVYLHILLIYNCGYIIYGRRDYSEWPVRSGLQAICLLSTPTGKNYETSTQKAKIAN